MANNISTFESKPAIIVDKRLGTSTSPFVPMNETLIVNTDGRVILSEIPDSFERVKVTSVGGEFWYEIKEGTPSPNQYKVDYINKVVTFAKENIGKQLTFQYLGTGNHYFSPHSIYTKENDGKVVETLGDIIDNSISIIDKVTIVEEMINQVQSDTTILKELVEEAVPNENLRKENETLRVQKENERLAAELTRLGNEDIRVASETDRTQKENERLLSETKRVSSENERKLNESTRILKENERLAYELERIQNEDLRLSSEITRVSSENSRETNEGLRNSAETLRTQKESERLLAEDDRIQSESTRKDNETLRISSEVTRVSNESNRELSETNRISSEDERKLNESTRLLKEQERVLSETARIQKEDERLLAETDRISSEIERKSNESLRVSNEEIRSSNETIREQNELARENTHTDLIDIKGVLDSQIISTQYIIDNFKLIGEFSEIVSYKRLNMVTYNGSSYICIKDSFGNLPTDSVYWSITAQRGVDGKGATSSVNGIFPDEYGNVVVTFNDASTSKKGMVQLEDSTTSNSTSLALTANQGKVLNDKVNSHISELSHIKFDNTITPESLPNTFKKTITYSDFGTNSSVVWRESVGITGNYASLITTERGEFGIPAQTVVFVNSANKYQIFKRTSFSFTAWGNWFEIYTDNSDFKSNVNKHMNDSILHVTQTDKNTWDNKADLIHNHTISEITNLQTTLNSKADQSEVTSHFANNTKHINLDDTITTATLPSYFSNGITISDFSSTNASDWRGLVGLTGTYNVQIKTERGKFGSTTQTLVFNNSSNNPITYERAAFVSTTWGTFKIIATKDDINSANYFYIDGTNTAGFDLDTPPNYYPRGKTLRMVVSNTNAMQQQCITLVNELLGYQLALSNTSIRFEIETNVSGIMISQNIVAYGNNNVTRAAPFLSMDRMASANNSEVWFSWSSKIHTVSGQGNPNGVLGGLVGLMYVDTLTGKVYKKTTGTTTMLVTSGWVEVGSEFMLFSNKAFTTATLPVGKVGFVY